MEPIEVLMVILQVFGIGIASYYWVKPFDNKQEDSVGYKKRVDGNQAQVTKELREQGFSVALTHTVGNGFPDFVVGRQGVNMLVELKDGNGKLTPKEEDFLSSFAGYVVVCRSTEEVVRAFDRYYVSLKAFGETK